MKIDEYGNFIIHNENDNFILMKIMLVLIVLGAIALVLYKKYK